MDRTLRRLGSGPRPAAWLMMLVLGLVPCALPADPLQEYTAKAALTFNFARYTSWPEAAVTASPDALRVCVVGDAALAEAFQAIGGRRIGSRRVRVKALRRRDDPRNCDLIFIDGRDRRKISLLLAGVRDLPVLTVAEIPGFSDYGGIIGLFQSGDKLRFEVSLKAAKRANLIISSSMLRLAKVIE